MKKIDRNNIAIILNNNARNVNKNIKEQVEQLIPKRNIFYTNSLEEADATIAKILNDDYTHIFTGGGDGTLVYFINKMKEIKRRAKLKKKLPAVGILRLGTGNAVAIYTNSGKKISDDLEVVLKGGTYKTDSIDFVKIGKKYFTFGGFGLDALILNDYDMMKKIPNKYLRYPFAGLKGYFVSALSITLPKTVFSKKNYVKIYANTDDPVYAVSVMGGFTKIEVKKGDLIYEGPFTMLPLGTTPYYGYGLKALPFANKKKGYMQLRIMDVPPAKLFFRVLQAWNGLYEGDDVKDFLVKEATLEFVRPIPLQIAGEAAGYEKKVQVQLSSEKIDFIKFED